MKSRTNKKFVFIPQIQTLNRPPPHPQQPKPPTNISTNSYLDIQNKSIARYDCLFTINELTMSCKYLYSPCPHSSYTVTLINYVNSAKIRRHHLFASSKWNIFMWNIWFCIYELQHIHYRCYDLTSTECVIWCFSLFDITWMYF